MTIRPLALALMLAGLAATAQAQPTPKDQYNQATKAAAARYADDKKICSGEATASVRMQCARDAKAEYEKSMGAAKDALKAAGVALCTGCGKVTAVHVTEKAGESGTAGAIAGGLAGALLGHQVGGGTGRSVATVAGAAGGAYAGNKIEKNMNKTKVWTVSVDYEDGKKGSFSFSKEPGFAVGDKVRREGKTIVRQ